MPRRDEHRAAGARRERNNAQARDGSRNDRRAGPLRCAIYTRKSTEEGLEQDFNSLDAQREAGEAYVRSQRHEGWVLLDNRYNDGGISGGTLERPAVQRLLDDIRLGKVDVVVVYKVDRLTRSLADFGKLVETFDAHRVSFVSVTQQFNTSTSMGRLTLNMLLSFAQFEREVTGERIRDKIAASKKKGMWMGGTVPAGYAAQDRTLVVRENEAELVRGIFSRYLELGSVRALMADLEARGIRSPKRTTDAGRHTGGCRFSRGQLYALLRNPIYCGKIRHKDRIYDGMHPPIIDAELWDTVQLKLAANRAERRSPTNRKEPSLLAGLLFTSDGERLRPTHAIKGSRRYRYYIADHLMRGAMRVGDAGLRLSAADAETTVLRGLCSFLRDRARLLETVALGDSPKQLGSLLERGAALAGQFQDNANDDRRDQLQDLIARVEIGGDTIRIVLRRWGLLDVLAPDTPMGDAAEQIEAGSSDALNIDLPFAIRRRGQETRLVLGGESNTPPCPDPALITALVRGRRWFDQFRNGAAASLAEIAACERVDCALITQSIALAFLAPDIVAAIVEGRQPADLTTKRLLRMADLPASWTEQRRVLGFV